MHSNFAPCSIRIRRSVVTTIVGSGVAALFLFIALAAWLTPQQATADEPATKDHSPAKSTWVLIVVGLPGDPERASRYAELIAVYESWAKTRLLVPEERLVVVGAGPNGDQPPRPASAKSLDAAFARLRERMQADDRFWMITLGHGNYDGRRAFLHVEGPDPPAEKWRQWLDSLPTADQTLWLTHSTSGWFVPVVSRLHRIVVAATATDEEANETEFPRALAATMGRSPEQLDDDKDGQVSVAELFQATTAEVERIYSADKRIATEHAQLDDNGDGRGAETLPAKPTAKQDGDVARQRRL